MLIDFVQEAGKRRSLYGGLSHLETLQEGQILLIHASYGTVEYDNETVPYCIVTFRYPIIPRYIKPIFFFGGGG
jgi:hypothetical protein